MPTLKLFAYQSGEQYITKASLIADKGMQVEVYPGTDSMYQTWEEAAKGLNVHVLDLFSSKYHRDFRDEQQVKEFLKPKLQQKATEMAGFLRSGIPSNPNKPNRVEVMADVPTKGKVRGSTEAAVKPFLANPTQAQSKLHEAIRQSVPDNGLQGRLNNFYEAQGFSAEDNYTLLWGRSSGRTNAAAPHLDTNPVMLAQMMISIRRLDPKRKLVVIGDPVNIPGKIGSDSVPRPDINLFQYWKSRDWPGDPSDMSAQMFFLALIQSHHPKTVSVGTNSGILELPHLMGMRTIYLENQHDHARKGKRWEKKWEMGTIHRLSTTTQTDLWGRQNALFEGVRSWMKENNGRVPGAYPGEHNDFLQELTQLASMNPNAQPAADQSRPFATKLAKVSGVWARQSGEPFAGSEAARSNSLAAMDSSEMKNRLTEKQVDRFERLWIGGLNREWLKDTDERWRTVLVDQQREPPAAAATDSDDMEPPQVAPPVRARRTSAFGPVGTTASGSHEV